MKVLPFTMLVPSHRSVITEEVALPHFYPYLHRHDEWQLTWVQKGSGTLIAGTSMQSFEPGDVFLIGANLPHLFKSNREYFTGDGMPAVKACSIYFNPSGPLKPLFSMTEMRGCLDFLAHQPYGFKVPAVAARRTADAMLKVHHAEGTRLINGFIGLMETLQGVRQAEPICGGHYTTRISESEGVRLSTSIGYILKNYHRPLALNEVANEACMTPHAFCRYFKRHTGQTFVTFLNEVRINDACKALTAGTGMAQVSEIAYKAGFGSVNNFNKAFKRVMRKSPTDYLSAFRTAAR